MKELFPIFKNNSDLVFLDSAASAQKPASVIEAMNEVMTNYYSNIHRGLYKQSQQTTEAYEDARAKVASFINANENEVVFTRGATESINLVVSSWGRANLKKDDEVIISIFEHHANIVPWQMLEKEIGIKLKVIPIAPSPLAERVVNEGYSTTPSPLAERVVNKGYSSTPSPLAGEGRGEGYNNPSHRIYSSKFKEYARDLRHESTEPEKIVWHFLRNSQTGYKFRRQHSIDNKYILDFVCLDKKLVIEIDGETHSDNEDDKIRDSYLENQGFEVLRFTNKEVLENMEGVWDVIMNKLDTPHPDPLPQGERENSSPLTSSYISQGDIELDFEAFKSMITPKTKFLSLTRMSNALGTVVNIKKFIAEAKKHNITVLIDDCQSIVHEKTDVKYLNCDFLVFSGHKLYGPTGIGVLYGKEEILNSMPPYQTGGDMIEKVSLKTRTTFHKAPARFEAGTPAIVEAIGLGVAIDFVNSLDREKISAKEKELANRVKEIEDIDIIGTNSNTIVSFTANWGAPDDIATLLANQNIAVRAGHHCAMPLMEELGISGTVRVSLGVYNDEQDIVKLEEAIIKCKKILS